MSDVIEVRGLRAMGVCGVLPEEQHRPQPLELDFDLHVDLSAAGASDALGDTVDYAAAIAAAELIVTTVHCALLEHLAALVADALLADDRVQHVTVSVRKLRPPVPQQVATTGVRVVRSR